MDETLDMISRDESPSQVSDSIKELLFQKATQRVDAFQPMVAKTAFDLEAGQEEETGDE